MTRTPSPARLIAALSLIAAIGTGSARSQTLADRTIHQIAVTPAPVASSVQEVLAVWSFRAEPSASATDLSTEVALRVNGVEVAVETANIMIDAGATACVDGPPCSGACGTATVDRGPATLFCYRDGPCTPCDCNCGYWITTAFPAQVFATGDEIMVILRPAPGAVPDGDASDNQLPLIFHDRPIGWNRGIEQVVLTPSGPGTFDVEAGGSLGWEARAGYANLDFELELRVNGVTVSSQNVPAELDGILDQTCWQQGCGASCGNVNGVPRYCDPYLWWDCGCVGGWISTFPGVPASPGDEIMVILRPAPGALPELPPLQGDDQAITGCCPPVSAPVVSAPVDARQLSQNRPNPFSPMTSIEFDIVEGGPARIDLFDVTGRRVRTLLDRTLTSGRWSVSWDGQLEGGARAPAGPYYYRLTTARGTEARRMTLLK